MTSGCASVRKQRFNRCSTDEASPLDTRTQSPSPLYLLERSDVGVVHLDRELMVVSFHPERVLLIKVTKLSDLHGDTTSTSAAWPNGWRARRSYASIAAFWPTSILRKRFRATTARSG